MRLSRCRRGNRDASSLLFKKDVTTNCFRNPVKGASPDPSFRIERSRAFKSTAIQHHDVDQSLGRGTDPPTALRWYTDCASLFVRELHASQSSFPAHALRCKSSSRKNASILIFRTFSHHMLARYSTSRLPTPRPTSAAPSSRISPRPGLTTGRLPVRRKDSSDGEDVENLLIAASSEEIAQHEAHEAIAHLRSQREEETRFRAWSDERKKRLNHIRQTLQDCQISCFEHGVSVNTKLQLSQYLKNAEREARKRIVLLQRSVEDRFEDTYRRLEQAVTVIDEAYNQRHSIRTQLTSQARVQGRQDWLEHCWQSHYHQRLKQVHDGEGLASQNLEYLGDHVYRLHYYWRVGPLMHNMDSLVQSMHHCREVFQEIKYKIQHDAWYRTSIALRATSVEVLIDGLKSVDGTHADLTTTLTRAGKVCVHLTGRMNNIIDTLPECKSRLRFLLSRVEITGAQAVIPAIAHVYRDRNRLCLVEEIYPGVLGHEVNHLMLHDKLTNIGMLRNEAWVCVYQLSHLARASKHSRSRSMIRHRLRIREQFLDENILRSISALFAKFAPSGLIYDRSTENDIVRQTRFFDILLFLEYQEGKKELLGSLKDVVLLNPANPPRAVQKFMSRCSETLDRLRMVSRPINRAMSKFLVFYTARTDLTGVRRTSIMTKACFESLERRHRVLQASKRLRRRRRLHDQSTSSLEEHDVETQYERDLTRVEETSQFAPFGVESDEDDTYYSLSAGGSAASELYPNLSNSDTKVDNKKPRSKGMLSSVISSVQKTVSSFFPWTSSRTKPNTRPTLFDNNLVLEDRTADSTTVFRAFSETNVSRKMTDENHFDVVFTASDGSTDTRTDDAPRPRNNDTTPATSSYTLERHSPDLKPETVTSIANVPVNKADTPAVESIDEDTAITTPSDLKPSTIPAFQSKPAARLTRRVPPGRSAPLILRKLSGKLGRRDTPSSD